MGKLLETRLPLAVSQHEPFVHSVIYNRMIRILEINLGRFDTTATPEYNDTQIAQNKFFQRAFFVDVDDFYFWIS